jgi:putative ABC transport system permease protein
MRLLRRLAYWARFRSHHAALMDELAFHRDMVERDLIGRGLSPPAAKDAARRTMGNETFMREDARGVWLWPGLETVWQDSTYTMRGLRRSPGFTAGVVLTLALGIGVNASMFSLVDRLLFRPPPLLRDPASTHRVYMYKTYEATERETGGQYVRYTDLAKWTSTFSQIAAFRERDLAVGVGDAARELPIGVVSAGFFGFFDAPPALGRYFSDSEDAPPTGTPLAVLSYATWQTRYDARGDVLGSAMQIGPMVYTIIGVAPAGFVGLWPDRPPVAFIPVTSYGGTTGSSDWWSSYNHAIGISVMVRRKPGVSSGAASADLTNAFRQSYRALREAVPQATPISLARPRAVAASILSERGPEASNVAKVATWLAGVALIVLLIACANVANLLLARAVRRRREIAVRIALGVSRARLFAQLLTESVLLAMIGGAAGVFIAEWGSVALRAAFLPDAERASVITDRRTALFAAAITLCVGVLAGLVPMLQVGRADHTDDLKSGSREGTYHRSRTRIALLVAQGALSVALLVGAGLFVRSLRNVQGVRLGYDVDPVLVVDFNMRGVALDSAGAVAMNLRLLEAAKSLPGVEHASLRKSLPFWGMESTALYVEGIDSVDKLGEFDLNDVSPEYFATMGTRILRGRGIEATDGDRARRVMVIGESMGAALWPGTDPIGRCVRIGAPTTPCTYVVGVAENIHTRNLGSEPGYYFYYLPAAQTSPRYLGLFVRTKGDGGRLLEPVRRRLQREMPGASYVTVGLFSDIIGLQTRSWNVAATVFTLFGALALLLAAIGLYSVTAYDVAQRRHELGVRLALGAQAFDVVRLVVADGVRFGVAGVAIGAGIALAAGRWIGPLLFNESPRDPAVFGVVTCALLGVSVAASWVPALRAAGVDPKAALQSD